MSRIMPMKIKFRLAGHFAGDKDHRISYRSERWSCNAVTITPKISQFEFGKSHIEWVMDGSERRWKTWAAFRRALAKAHGVKP